MSCLNFKIAIFDLDWTLWDGTQLYAETVQILTNLASHGIHMYVASFHTSAQEQCKMLGIDHFFTGILYGRDRPKSEMIRDIIAHHQNVLPSDIVFFDDTFENLLEVKMAHNIKTIHVSKSDGITWRDIPKVDSASWHWTYNYVIVK